MEKIVRRYGRQGFLRLYSILVIAVSASVFSQDNPPVVHAVLFYSPTCPHCHQVLAEDIPPLLERYGEQLQVLALNTHDIEGQKLYQAAIRYFAIPPSRHGVPTLIVGTTVWVGSREIPDRFPAMVNQGLAEGGIEWPALPGLDRRVQTRIQTGNKTVANDPAITATERTLVQRFAGTPWAMDSP